MPVTARRPQQPPEGPTGVDVGRAIAYGLELGVRELVGPNPFAAEPSLRGWAHLEDHGEEPVQITASPRRSPA